MDKTIPVCYLDEKGDCRVRGSNSVMKIDLFHVTSGDNFEGICNDGLVGRGFDDDTVHQRIKDMWKYGDPSYPHKVAPSELSDEEYEGLVQDVIESHGDRVFAGKQRYLYEMFEDAGARGVFWKSDPVLIGIKKECSDLFDQDPVDLEWEWTAKNTDIPPSCLVRVSNWKSIIKPQIKMHKNDLLWTDLFSEAMEK